MLAPSGAFPLASSFDSASISAQFSFGDELILFGFLGGGLLPLQLGSFAHGVFFQAHFAVGVGVGQ